MDNDYDNNKMSIERGNTGFDDVDKLSPEERIKLAKHAWEHWYTILSPEQRVQQLDNYYAMIREKKRADGGKLMNVSDMDVAREIFNKDLPNQLDHMVQELEEEANTIVDPQEQAHYREFVDETINQLLALYKYREKENEKKKEETKRQ
jgi:hypothetical protein